MSSPKAEDKPHDEVREHAEGEGEEGNDEVRKACHNTRPPSLTCR